jgi:hypothetical protein
MLAAFAACAVSEAKTPSDITVELSSVTLGDDCNLPAPPPPKTKFAKPPAARADADPDADPPGLSQDRRAPGGGAAHGKCAGPNCNVGRRACQQTSMQLALTAQASAKQTTIKIKRVELLDSKGKVLQELTASAPSAWTQNAYASWDQTLGGGDTVRASYRLSSPNWNKLTNGRMNAHGHTFQLRVTITIGNSSRTVEKTSITPARIEPMVVT